MMHSFNGCCHAVVNINGCVVEFAATYCMQGQPVGSVEGLKWAYLGAYVSWGH